MSLKRLPEKIYIAAYKDWKSSYQLQKIIYGYREKKITKYLFDYFKKGYFEHIDRKWRSTTKGLLDEISQYIKLDKDELESINSLLNNDSFRNLIEYHKDKKPSMLKLLNVIQITAFVIDKIQTEGWMKNIQPDKQEAEKFKANFNRRLTSTTEFKKIDWDNIPMGLFAWIMQFFNVKQSTIKKLKTLPQHQCSQELIFIARSAAPVKD
ncbi:Uncharacterised protein [uncultured archaeon]|nr:Uncharacterised protein [uncultured archaeon]